MVSGTFAVRQTTDDVDVDRVASGSYDYASLEVDKPPRCRIDVANPSGIEMFRLDNGKELEIRRNGLLEFPGIIETPAGTEGDDSATMVAAEGIHKGYHKLRQAQCTSYDFDEDGNAATTRDAVTINPWETFILRKDDGALDEYGNAQPVDGIAVDDYIKHLLGTKFVYQHRFEDNSHLLASQANARGSSPYLTVYRDAKTGDKSMALQRYRNGDTFTADGTVESVPLYNNDRNISRMGEILSAQVLLIGQRTSRVFESLLGASLVDVANRWDDSTGQGNSLSATGSPATRDAVTLTKYNLGMNLDGTNDAFYLGGSSFQNRLTGDVAFFWAGIIDVMPTGAQRAHLGGLFDDGSPDGETPFSVYVDSNGRVNYEHRSGSYTVNFQTLGADVTTGTEFRIWVRRVAATGQVSIGVNRSVGAGSLYDYLYDPVAQPPTYPALPGLFQIGTDSVTAVGRYFFDGGVWEARLWEKALDQATLDVISDTARNDYKALREGTEFACWFMDGETDPRTASFTGSHPTLQLCRNAVEPTRTYTSVTLTPGTNYNGSGFDYWTGSITFSGTEVNKNALGYKITLPGAGSDTGSTKVFYVKVICTTISDTGLSEGSIAAYDNPWEFHGEENWIATDMQGFNRLEAMEKVRKMTEADQAVSPDPHWDIWIDSSLALHFAQRRGGTAAGYRNYSFAAETLRKIRHEFYGGELAYQTMAYGAGSGIAQTRIVTKQDFASTTGGLYDADRDPNAPYPGLVGWWKFDEAAGFGQELVANGGFETYTVSPGAPDSWTLVSGSTDTVTREQGIVRTGANAAKITAAGANKFGIGQVLTLTAGKSYYVEAYARTEGAANTQARLLIVNQTDASAVVVERLGSVASTAFEKLSGTFEAVAGKTYRVQVRNRTAAVDGEVVYFDDVSVKEIRLEDSSGNGNHGAPKGGTNTAGPNIGATGQVGMAYSFDGTDDYVAIPDHATLDLATQGSWGAWFKCDDFGSTYRVINKGLNRYCIRIPTSGIPAVRALFVGDGTSETEAAATTPIAAGSMVFVVGTYDGANIICYVNGLEVARTAKVGVISTDSEPLYLGAASAAVGFLDGVQDESFVFNRPLSATEIAWLYRQGLAGRSSQPSAGTRIYGDLPRVMSFVDSNEVSAVALLRKARAFHRLHRDPIENVELEISTESIPHFGVGDSINIINYKTRTNGHLRVINMSRSWSGSDIERIRVEVGRKDAGFFDGINSGRDQTKTISIHSQPNEGTTGISGDGVYCTDTIHGVYRFPIQDGRSIERVFLDITTLPWQITSRGGLSATHTHSATAGDGQTGAGSGITDARGVSSSASPRVVVGGRTSIAVPADGSFSSFTTVGTFTPGSSETLADYILGQVYAYNDDSAAHNFDVELRVIRNSNSDIVAPANFTTPSDSPAPQSDANGGFGTTYDDTIYNSVQFCEDFTMALVSGQLYNVQIRVRLRGGVAGTGYTDQFGVNAAIFFNHLHDRLDHQHNITISPSGAHVHPFDFGIWQFDGDSGNGTGTPVYGTGIRVAIDATTNAAGIPSNFANERHPVMFGTAAQPQNIRLDVTGLLRAASGGGIDDGVHTAHFLATAGANNAKALSVVSVTPIFKFREAEA